MDVKMNLFVYIAMDGKNRSITLITISLILADMESNVLRSTVHTIIMILIRDKVFLSGSNYFLSQELLTFRQITICLTCGT